MSENSEDFTVSVTFEEVQGFIADAEAASAAIAAERAKLALAKRRLEAVRVLAPHLLPAPNP